MPDKNSVNVDRARRQAKKIARTSDITHQQALDQIARDLGFAHWSDMLQKAKQGAPVIDDAEASPTTTKSQATALDFSTWLADRTRADTNDTHIRAVRIDALPLSVRTIAQALDPFGGPYEECRTVRMVCPIHQGAKKTLLLEHRADAVVARCSAGCYLEPLLDAALKELRTACVDAETFVTANNASPVISGAAIGNGGQGGFYTLENGRHFRLNILSTRMLPEGWPIWVHDLPRRGLG